MRKQPAPGAASEKQFLEEMSHALAGWSDPAARLREEEKALRQPGEFLPVFEHFRMMPDLDRWVAHHVIDQLRKGSRIGRFSINISGQTLADRDFPGFVADELKSAGIPAAALLFEIDESDSLLQPAVAVTRRASATVSRRRLKRSRRR